MIELKKNIFAKNVDLDELYSEVFLIFQFDTLLTLHFSPLGNTVTDFHA